MNRDRRASLAFVDSPTEGDTFFFETRLRARGHALVAGVDEAGRGPLAGPVVAGCVVLEPEGDHSCYRDSKKLGPGRREELFQRLHESDALTGVGIVSPREIEELNILQAALEAMRRAVLDCLDGGLPDFLLVDGTFTVPLAVAQQPLVKGESRSASIAAASIIAKVTRDRIMAEAHHRFPQYNFRKNQGYPTREHREAIRIHGPCPLHRRTFKGVREFLDPDAAAPAPVQPGLWSGE